MSAYDEIKSLEAHVKKHIIGQDKLVNRLLIALLTGGHLLVEGAPGLAKTKAIRAISSGLEGDYQRIQFTPDLLPSDLTGSEIYRQKSGTFEFQQGPIFNNILLADEINRAPAKVQSALLEAMGEGQVSIGRQSYLLPPLFLVMATQNPIEQDGTYPLPEAQLDRFMLHISIDYPKAKNEKEILVLNRQEAIDNINIEANRKKVMTQKSVFQARKDILNLHMTDAIEDYIVAIVVATRQCDKYGSDLPRLLRYGASPRGTISLDRAARANAWLKGRDYVSPEDVQEVAQDVLRHRLLMSYEAQSEGINSDYFSQLLLERVACP